MRLDQLRNFVWLVKIKSFTETAEQLHMSTSALSKSIKSLEEHVGTTLVNRDTTPLSLTKVGSEFYEFALEASAEYEYFTQKYRKDRKVSFEQIRVFSLPGADQVFVMEAIGKTANRFPDTEFIHVSRSAFSVFSEALEQDASLLLLPDFEFARPIYQNFEAYDLPPVSFASYCCAGHPILQREAIAYADLWDFPICGPLLPPEVDEIIINFIGADRIKRRPLFNLYYEHMATAHKTLIDTNFISAGLPKKAMESFVERGILCEVPVLSHPFENMGVKLLVKKEVRRSVALKALIADIIECAQKRL